MIFLSTQRGDELGLSTLLNEARHDASMSGPELWRVDHALYGESPVSGLWQASRFWWANAGAGGAARTRGLAVQDGAINLVGSGCDLSLRVVGQHALPAALGKFGAQVWIGKQAE